MVYNVNEQVVKERLDKYLSEFDCCKCEKCVGDMTAMALNHLKPAYVNSQAGELFSRIDASRLQNTTHIDVEIIKAINSVASNPKH